MARAKSSAKKAVAAPTTGVAVKATPAVRRAPASRSGEVGMISGRRGAMPARPHDITQRLEEFRSALLAQRRRLFAQVVQLEDDLRWLDEDVEPEVVEEGQEQTIARLLERLDERGRAEIAAIDRALTRIERGEYGVCRACGEPIPLARQRAVPTADTCLPCAKMREALERP